MSNGSIWLIDRTQSGTTNPGQSWPGSNGNEGILLISQSSKAEASPSDCFVLYTGHSLGESCPSVYSAAPDDCTHE